jgi:hypothetical protein
MIYFQPSHHSVSADGRTWNVVGEYNNSPQAAELLSRTNSQMIEFLRYLKKKYHIDETEDYIHSHMDTHNAILNAPNDTYNIVDALLNNYNPDVFFENHPRSPDTSYTINKGQAMYICLRRKDNPMQLVDPNILMFVMLHEMAHIANYRGWGHEADFWEVFKFILHEAYQAGLYTPVDYSKYPINYCGLNVTYSPYFNPDITSLWLK